MGMLGRYQKQGGFSQLLALIEGFGPEKRKKFLELIKEENSTWAEAIESKMISMEKICSWHSDVLREIFSRLRPLTVSVALHGLTEADREKIFAVLGFSQGREIRDQFESSKPNNGEILAVYMKIISEVRGMEAQGLIRFDKIDKSLAIPDGFEQQLDELSKNQNSQNTLDKFHAQMAAQEKSQSQVSSGNLGLVESTPRAPGSESQSDKGTTKDKSSFEGFSAAEGAKLYQQIQTLTKQVQSLQEENHLLKATLEQISKLTKINTQALKRAA